MNFNFMFVLPTANQQGSMFQGWWNIDKTPTYKGQNTMKRKWRSALSPFAFCVAIITNNSIMYLIKKNSYSLNFRTNEEVNNLPSVSCLYFKRSENVP